VNLTQVQELEQDLLQALRAELRSEVWPGGALCRYDGAGSLVQGRNLILGFYRVGIWLRPVGQETGRHTLVVRTPRTQTKFFRETKAGWFVVQNVAKHLVSVLQCEMTFRQEEARQRQLQQTARNGVQRLEALGLPDGCSIASSEVPGALDLVVEGLTEPAVRQTLEFLRTLLRKPSDSTLGLWAQLQSNDD
jgi:hypothetical protein